MRVLVVGKNNMLQWPQHVQEAWNELGWETKLFLYNDLGVGSKILSTVFKQLDRAYSESYLAHLFQKAIKKFEPDVIMFVSAFFMPQALYDVLENLLHKPLIIGWIGDGVNQDFEHQAKLFDKLYITDSHFVHKALEFGWKQADYLPLAFNPRIFFPSETGSRSKDVIFVGNPCSERESLFRQLHRPVTLIGPKWKTFHDSPHHIVAKEVSLKQVAQLYQGCGGVINIKQGVNVVNGLNMRSFEAPACGTLLFHDNVADVHRHFRVGEEVLVYQNSLELDDYLQMLDKNAEACDAIRRRGMERVWDEHTYKHRINAIITASGL